MNDQSTDLATSDGSADVEVPADGAQSAAVSSAVIADATATGVEKARVGRKVDATGETALGFARILYAQNPTLGTKELKALFAKELTPKFGSKANVIQTYVSTVRKPKAEKKAA